VPKSAYVYRLGKVASLLDEAEWRDIDILLNNRVQWIKKYRQEKKCSLPEAVKFEPIGQVALDRYEELTGCRLDHPDQLWAVQMSQYGSPCPSCGKPFRTPKAKICAECGYALPDGMVAGPFGTPAN